MNRYIEIWVCPSCGNYYGSSSIEGQDLSTQVNYRRQEITEGGQRIWKNAPSGTRDLCPNCRTPRVKRKAFIIGNPAEVHDASSSQEAV